MAHRKKTLTVRGTNGKQTNSGRFQKGNKFGYRFKPGYDPNRNYHGRPKDHDELRDLIRDVGREIAENDPSKRARIYNLIERMFESEIAADHSNILEHGWGKVPQPIDINKMTDAELVEFIQKSLGISGLGVGGSPAPEPDSENSPTPT